MLRCFPAEKVVLKAGAGECVNFAELTPVGAHERGSHSLQSAYRSSLKTSPRSREALLFAALVFCHLLIYVAVQGAVWVVAAACVL